ncbi:MAG: preprotein translocase subunit SecE [Tissierellia bacterium]|nr:preprotein translocase subunit SecE [Tissierellia bacterium]
MAKAKTGKEQDASSLKRYFQGVRSEFKKVIWPSKKQITNYSLVVIAVSIVTAIFIQVLDAVFQGLLSVLIG